MHTEQNRITGDFYVTENLTLSLSGLISGSATVAPGIEFVLNGKVSGDLTLEHHSTATLNGTVDGNVYNDGGDLTILGRVEGTLRSSSGRTRIDPHAYVGRRA
jgi:cytoskeletal protein CcmA (bactofilin family)